MGFCVQDHLLTMQMHTGEPVFVSVLIGGRRKQVDQGHGPFI